MREQLPGKRALFLEDAPLYKLVVMGDTVAESDSPWDLFCKLIDLENAQTLADASNVSIDVAIRSDEGREIQYPLFFSSELQQLVRTERALVPARCFSPAAKSLGDEKDADDEESFDDSVAGRLARMREQRKAEIRLHPIRERLIDVAWALRRFFRDTANPIDMSRKSKWAWQRITRGWSDRDTWGMGENIVEQIIAMLTFLREAGHHYSTPIKMNYHYSPQEWHDRIMQGNGWEWDGFSEEEWWGDIIGTIIRAFTNWHLAHYGAFTAWEQLTPEEYRRIDEEFEQAGRLFFAHIHGIHD